MRVFFPFSETNQSVTKSMKSTSYVFFSFRLVFFFLPCDYTVWISDISYYYYQYVRTKSVKPLRNPTANGSPLIFCSVLDISLSGVTFVSFLSRPLVQ